MDEFAKVTIKNEGDIADPDEFTWECNCKKCKDKYDKWKVRFDKQEEAYMKLATAHELAVSVTTGDLKIDYSGREQHANEINSLQDDIRVLEEDRDHWKQKALKNKKVVKLAKGIKKYLQWKE